MVRNRGKMALYEVLNRAKAKAEESQASDKATAADGEKPAKAEKPMKSVWSGRPKLVSVSPGRVEFSIPYQLAIAIVLGVLLVVLISFRFGQVSGKKIAQAGVGTDFSPVAEVEDSLPAFTDDTVFGDPGVSGTNVFVPSGNHIVIQQYNVGRDLRPVRRHFEDNGIDCAIVESSGKYLLITKNSYDNPARVGTNGYKALRKIREVGAEYKAPTGYESFAPKLFSDAYGKKF